MDDFVKRKDVIEAFDDSRVERNYGDVDPDSVIRVIETIPAADVRPVVRGKWEWVDDYRYPWGCTNCHNTFSGWHNFCPNCGADMRGNNG